MPVWLQLVIGIIITAGGIFWIYAEINQEAKNEKCILQKLQQFLSRLSKHCKFFLLCLFIVVLSVGVILLINAIITGSKNYHWVVESPLMYSDVILLLIGLIGDIAIASATFVLQHNIDEKNRAIEAKQKEEEQNRQKLEKQIETKLVEEREQREKQIEEKRQELERQSAREYQQRLAQQQHHLWMSEHFGSIQSSSQTICKGINLNINKEEKKDYENGKLLIRVENRSDNGTYLFHPQYFSVKPKLTWERQAEGTLEFKEKSEEGSGNSSAFCLDANKLDIVFGESEKASVKNALLYPCSIIPSSKSQTEKLSPESFQFKLEITAEDRSYLMNEGGKSMAYKITYTIYFTLTQKSTYGYDDKGTFELVMSDYSISAEPPELVEKGEFVAA